MRLRSVVGEKVSEVQEVVIEARGAEPVVETGTRPSAPESEPPKRKRGRPKGVPNKVNRIAKEAIAEAEPHSFLIRVMEGRVFKRAGESGAKRRTGCYPTLTESISAAETLLRKISPDLKATELTGKDGAPLVEPTYSTTEVARRIAFILAKATQD